MKQNMNEIDKLIIDFELDEKEMGQNVNQFEKDYEELEF